MKKIVAYLKGKVEDRKIDNKVKRINLALETSELNFKSQKDDAEIKLEELLEKFNADDCNIESVITEISDNMTAVKEAEEGLQRIKEIKEMLFEELK